MAYSRGLKKSTQYAFPLCVEVHIGDSIHPMIFFILASLLKLGATRSSDEDFRFEMRWSCKVLFLDYCVHYSVPLGLVNSDLGCTWRFKATSLWIIKLCYTHTNRAQFKSFCEANSCHEHL